MSETYAENNVDRDIALNYLSFVFILSILLDARFRGRDMDYRSTNEEQVF